MFMSAFLPSSQHELISDIVTFKNNIVVAVDNSLVVAERNWLLKFSGGFACPLHIQNWSSTSTYYNRYKYLCHAYKFHYVFVKNHLLTFVAGCWSLISLPLGCGASLPLGCGASLPLGLGTTYVPRPGLWPRPILHLYLSSLPQCPRLKDTEEEQVSISHQKLETKSTFSGLSPYSNDWSGPWLTASTSSPASPASLPWGPRLKDLIEANVRSNCSNFKFKPTYVGYCPTTPPSGRPGGWLLSQTRPPASLPWGSRLKDLIKH